VTERHKLATVLPSVLVAPDFLPSVGNSDLFFSLGSC
jgi:hypothetical protein